MIKLYSKKDCAKCSEIKEVMTSKKIAFTEFPTDEEENLSFLIEQGVDISELPIIEKDGKFYTNKTTGLMRAILNA